MSNIQPEDLFLIHREGTDYKAKVEDFAKDLNINLTVDCGSGGGGMDCDGVFDCLVNAPMDPPKYSVVNESKLDDHKDHMHHQYMVTCDPQTFLPYPVGHEKHDFEGGNKAIFTIPYLWNASVMIAAPPPVDVHGLEEVYGFHPTVPHVKNLSWKYIDDLRSLANPEDIWTSGYTDDPWRTRGHYSLWGPNCDKDPDCEWFGTSDEEYCDCEPGRTDEEINKAAYVASFECHRGDTYQIAIILWGVGAIQSAAKDDEDTDTEGGN